MAPNTFFLDVKTLGIPEVTGFISQIDHELKQGLRDRLKEASKLVAEEMESRTHSRRVRSAITSTVEVRSLIDYEARIGPLQRKAFFAHFLEFGTKAGPGHAATRAFPFALPALEATEDRVVDLVGIPPSLGGRRSR